MSPLLALLLGTFIILLLIVANGYFVAQEFAYMSVDRSRLRAHASTGDAVAARTLKVTDRTSFMLSGAQLGITVTGLLVGYVAEPLVGESLGVLLGGAGVPSAVSIAVGTTGALVIATVVQMIFGELYPKNLAIAVPEPIARALSRSTLIYLAVMGWLITVFDHSSNALLKLFGMQPVHDVDSTATAKDLEHIVADARRSGELPHDLSLVLERVLDFPERDVAHAMVPHGVVDTVSTRTEVGEALQMMATGHTRYPVLDDDGHPVGLVQLTGLIGTGIDRGARVQEVMSAVRIVPEAMALPGVLARMTADGDELVCVIDEFGGFAGILTLEDLAEELVGEIYDEHDPVIEDVVAHPDRLTWEVPGDLHTDEVERLIGHRLPEGDHETLAGLLIAEEGDLPAAGSSVEVRLPDEPGDLVLEVPVRRELRIDVLEVEHHVPSKLRVQLVEAESAPAVTDGASGQRRTDHEEDAR